MTDSEFYTRRGDDGLTGLLGPERVPKNDPRPEAYGTVDELQASLGVVRACDCTARTEQILLRVQRDLFALMSEIAALGDETSPFAGSVTSQHVDQLEEWIAQFEALVEMPREFVLPGDSQSGAALHLGRTIARRAERRIVGLYQERRTKNSNLLSYLNRLSSLLFVMACYEDQSRTGYAPTLAVS